jgi:hypothetical protein
VLKWLIRRRLAAFERSFDYDASYMRQVLDSDPAAFVRFSRLMGVSRYRKDVPLGAYYGAKLTATVAEDCGPCAQLIVTMALRDGLPARTVASILGHGDAAMSPDVALGVTWARATLAHAPEADALREDILRQWGPRALVSLGFALVSARVFPTLKYALGHGMACQRLVVEGASVAVKGAA